MVDSASALIRALDVFVAAAAESQIDCGRTLGVISDLRDAVADEFDLDLPERYRQRVKRSAGEARLARQLSYHKKKRQAVEEELRVVKTGKAGGLIRTELFVKVGLLSPDLNNRQVREVLRADGGSVSHTYVGRIRGAFVELIKDCVLRSVQAQIASVASDIGQPAIVYVCHVHDEASMRYRSYNSNAEFGTTFNRGRYSKVQNNAVTVYVGGEGSGVEWFTELQPLARKDGPTLATAIAAVVQPIIGMAAASYSSQHPRSFRVLHMLVGDGVNTNENASKRVLNHFLNQHPTGRVLYRLLVWRCASHQANLVVVVAIAGKLGGSVLDNSPLCATLSRLYKFLVPSYLDEFTAQLRNLVASTFELRTDVDSEDSLFHQDRARKLVSLYGHHVLPEELMHIRNRDLCRMEHLAVQGFDYAVFRFLRCFEVSP